MSRYAALRGAMSVAVVTLSVLGCSDSVSGTARSAPGQPPSSSTTRTGGTPLPPPPPPTTPSLTAILPDADQWFDALGRQADLYPIAVRGTDALGRQDEGGDWTNRDCLGVALIGLESVFTAAPVTAVINDYPVFEVQVVVVAYRDPAAAATLFATNADRWQQCAGKTAVNSSVPPPFINVIGDVRNTPTTVSTVLTIPGNYQQVYQRAFAVAGRCLIDVAVPVNTDGPGPPTPADAATRAVADMQDRAPSAAC